MASHGLSPLPFDELIANDIPEYSFLLDDKTSDIINGNVVVEQKSSTSLFATSADMIDGSKSLCMPKLQKTVSFSDDNMLANDRDPFRKSDDMNVLHSSDDDDDDRSNAELIEDISCLPISISTLHPPVVGNLQNTSLFTSNSTSTNSNRIRAQSLPLDLLLIPSLRLQGIDNNINNNSGNNIDDDILLSGPSTASSSYFLASLPSTPRAPNTRLCAEKISKFVYQKLFLKKYGRRLLFQLKVRDVIYYEVFPLLWDTVYLLCITSFLYPFYCGMGGNVNDTGYGENYYSSQAQGSGSIGSEIGVSFASSSLYARCHHNAVGNDRNASLISGVSCMCFKFFQQYFMNEKYLLYVDVRYVNFTGLSQRLLYHFKNLVIKILFLLSIPNHISLDTYDLSNEMTSIDSTQGDMSTVQKSYDGSASYLYPYSSHMSSSTDWDIVDLTRYMTFMSFIMVTALIFILYVIIQRKIPKLISIFERHQYAVIQSRRQQRIARDEQLKGEIFNIPTKILFFLADLVLSLFLSFTIFFQSFVWVLHLLTIEGYWSEIIGVIRNPQSGMLEMIGLSLLLIPILTFPIIFFYILWRISSLIREFKKFN